ncbi:trace amine-associated receptor 13c-like [Triplophysa rosa]|uniref:Trace amine-associated receptor 13c-like n=1 Tax=Triplophysa rosa TaxID=992332 RepID=A0A9W8C1N2_TRIRA|nr:trace amine-associated receptor 13c-like [Triplophysa rosa]KAI7805750.1 putative trace amine-associated receptor 13c-like [Triplophysa rosa]
MSDWGLTNTDNQTIQYCFPNHNLSCTRNSRLEFEYIIVYIFVSAMSALTVILNLLVIISISHFKQLHTATNVLVLSLAVADLMSGLILLPVQGIKLIESCWYFGEIICSIFPLVLYVVVKESLGNMIIISVDRFIAVNDPLRYPMRVTHNRVVFSIVGNWLFSAFYSFYLLYDFLLYPERNHKCLGECVLIVTLENLIIDAIVCLVAPCFVIISLYVKICIVAKHQAEHLNSFTAKKVNSEKKATRTLGIVVMVYILCWLPYYLITLSLGHDENDALIINVMYWIMCLNSCMNPLIYAMFYPWFRISTKYILTLKIFEPSSEYFNLFPGEK